MSIKKFENINLVGVEKICFLPKILSFYYSRLNTTGICFCVPYFSVCVHTHARTQTQYEIETSFCVGTSNIKPDMEATNMFVYLSFTYS